MPPDTVLDLESAQVALQLLIRACALRHIKRRQRVYAVELYNRVRKVRGGDEATMTLVGATLRTMEAEGLLVSSLEQGTTLLRRYYRLAQKGAAHG